MKFNYWNGQLFDLVFRNTSITSSDTSCNILVCGCHTCGMPKKSYQMSQSIQFLCSCAVQTCLHKALLTHGFCPFYGDLTVEFFTVVQQTKGHLGSYRSIQPSMYCKQIDFLQISRCFKLKWLPSTGAPVPDTVSSLLGNTSSDPLASAMRSLVTSRKGAVWQVVTRQEGFFHCNAT